MRSAGAWLMGLVLLACAAGVASAEAVPAAASAPAGPGTAVLMDLDGPIGPASAAYVRRGLSLAALEHAQLVVLQLDTPGGLDSAMRDIVEHILASPVPVATFVAPDGARAAGAGSYILLASHVAAMAPASNLGAPRPMAIGTPSQSPDKAAAPAAPTSTASGQPLAAASAYIRSLALLRGRNADWAEQAVRESASLPAQEALQKNVVTLVAGDVSDLLRQLNGRRLPVGKDTVRLATQGMQVLVFEPDWRIRLLSLITQPGLVLVLLMVGIGGLLFEFAHPGIVLPGVVGVLSLMLALFGLQMLPFSYAGLGLILLGVACLVAEAYLPVFGALGVGGIAAFAAGAMLLIDDDAPGFGVSPWLVASLSVASAVFIVLVAGMAARARRRPARSGVSTLVGAIGELVEFEDGEGWAHIEGDYWRVHGAPGLRPGGRIRVTHVQDLALQVAAVGPE